MSFIVHRVAKHAARYTDAGGREKCGLCRFFVAPRSCGKVIGPVSPMGWCKYFSRQMVSQFGGSTVGAGIPSFDQSFLGGSLGTGAVFTRASTGTYFDSGGVLRSAAINTPRFDYDPVTLQMKGLLLEDTSTNLALQSTTGAVPWASASAVVALPTVSANNAVAPDGTTTATRLIYPAVIGAGAVSVFYQAITVTAVSHAFSVWLRGNAGGEQIYLCVNPTRYSGPRLTLTTQWQRFTFITPTLTAASWALEIGTDLNDGTQTSTPAQTVYAWGAQVESIGYQTSYIPTTSTQVARAADSLRYPIASVTGFNPTQGSLAHDYIMEGHIGYGAPAQFIGANSSIDFISVDELTTAGQTRGDTPSLTGVSVVVGGSATANNFFTTIAIPPGVVHRGASAWKQTSGIIGAHDTISTVSPVGSAPSITAVTDLTVAGYMHYQNMASQWARRTRYWPRQLSQTELIRETTLDGPTLSLDFMQPGSLDSRIVFSRASSATYTDASGVIQTATTNAPRWDYKAGVLQGLLIEEQRTNLALQSANIAVAPWTTYNVTSALPVVTANQSSSPDGTTTAARIVYPAVSVAGSVSIVFQSFAASAAVYTYSVWLKGNAGDEQTYININGLGGIVVSVRCTLTTQWQRFSVTSPTLSAGTAYCEVGTDFRGGDQASTPAQTIYAWGAQLEQGAFVTSYIPTTSTAVTRANDVCYIPTNVSWANASAFTMLAEYYYDNATGTPLLGVSDNVFGENTCYLTTSPSGMNKVGAGGGTATSVTNPIVGAVNKSAGALTTAQLRACVNGSGVGAFNSTMNAPSGALRLVAGSDPWGMGGGFGGHFRRIQYWNRALSDAEMQTVTT